MTLGYHLFRSEPRIVSVQKGDLLFEEGEPSDERMYLLVSGVAHIRVKGHLAEEAGPGTIVGEMGIISPDEVRSASVLAVTDCEFAELGPKQFHFLVEQAPGFALSVMRVLASRLRHTNQMIA